MARAPAKAAAPAAKAPAKKPGTAVVNWSEELAKYAKEAKKTEEAVSTGRFISVKAGVMSYNGSPIPGNAIDAVIVDHIIENHYYTAEYDPNNPASPICFAFGRTDEEMAPHEKSEEPQAESCATCPHNEWGSDPRGGKGKACGNVRRLALLPEDQLEDVGTAEVAFLKVPTMSVKGWAGYVNQIANTLSRPPFAVVTTVSVVPDAKTQIKVLFEMKESIEDGDTIGALIEKRKSVEQDIATPYQPTPEAPPQPARRGGKAAPAANKALARGGRR